MRNVSDKSSGENKNTHLCSIIFFKNPAFYETMCKNNVQPGTPQITICACVLHAGYLDTHSEYVILIAVPLQQWLHNTPQCYVVIRTSPALFLFYFDFQARGGREDIYFYQM